MNAQTLRSGIRAIVKSHLGQGAAAGGGSHAVATPNSSGASSVSPSAIVIPLRINGPQDMHLLTQLFKRLAASPALSQAAAAGLIRLDVALGQSALAACCEPCQAGAQDACTCASSGQNPTCASDRSDPSCAPPTELTGLVSEKSVRKLGPQVRQVTLSASAIVTPLGRDELKRRGITLLQV
jgi:hypothetical protein